VRFDTPIFFQTITAGVYNPADGNYSGDGLTEEMRYAAVTDTGDDTLHLVFGEIKQGVKTVRLQNHYDKPFDQIRIGEKVYKVKRERLLRHKHIFIVSEVQ
jgi:hypothetical protein